MREAIHVLSIVALWVFLIWLGFIAVNQHQNGLLQLLIALGATGIAFSVAFFRYVRFP
jgi:hypothetical protein